jgi:hypothetical protein
VQPLFNTGAWAKAKNILKEIQQGYYSDPPGFNGFYTVRLDDKGTPKTDKHGIQLIACRRGAHDIKNAHRNFTKTFSNSLTGVEFVSCLLIQRLHRRNICMGRQYIAGSPWAGHYDIWKLDCLQKLIEKNISLVFLSKHNWASNYRDTTESLQMVAIHPQQELHSAVAAVKIKMDIIFSWDVQFMCQALGIPIPFLPVSGKDEYRLITLLVHHLSGFDDEKMAIVEWCKHVDGVSIFPKLPVYFCGYHNPWLISESKMLSRI